MTDGCNTSTPCIGCSFHECLDGLFHSLQNLVVHDDKSAFPVNHGREEERRMVDWSLRTSRPFSPSWIIRTSRSPRAHAV